MPASITRQRGVTLIELLIVISLMSILAAAVLPSATPGLHSQLSAAAHRVAGDIAYCRSLALTNNSQYRIRFQLAQNRYLLEHSGNRSALDVLPPSLLRAESDPPHQQIVHLHDLPGVTMPVDLVAVEERSSPPRFVTTLAFGPLGNLEGANATVQDAEIVIWLACGHAPDRLYQAIRVNPVTGLTWVDRVQSNQPNTPIH